jgi:hypothetical protein
VLELRPNSPRVSVWTVEPMAIGKWLWSVSMTMRSNLI